MTILISIISSLQIGFFPKERAFSLRYQTAGMLDTTLRQGVLGEDDTGEESPRLVSHTLWLFFCINIFMLHEAYNNFFRNLKLPSRRPSLVCENCLYSKEMDRRARAFHIMDPKGVLEMLIVFLEERGLENLTHPVLDNAQVSFCWY